MKVKLATLQYHTLLLRFIISIIESDSVTRESHLSVNMDQTIKKESTTFHNFCGAICLNKGG